MQKRSNWSTWHLITQVSLHYIIVGFFLNWMWPFSVMPSSKLNNPDSRLHLWLGKEKKPFSRVKTITTDPTTHSLQNVTLGLWCYQSTAQLGLALHHHATVSWRRPSSTVPGILWLWTIGLWTRLLHLQKQSSAGHSHLKHNFLLRPIHAPTAELKADPALLTAISIKYFTHFTAAVCSTKQCVSLLSHEQLPTALPQAPLVGKMFS